MEAIINGFITVVFIFVGLMVANGEKIWGASHNFIECNQGRNVETRIYINHLLH